MVIRRALLAVLAIIFLAACAQATGEPTLSPTLSSLPSPSTTVSPIPTQLPSFPERWREYEIALGQKMIPYASTSPSASIEEIICEWEVLEESENELYVWAVCTTTFPFPQTDGDFPGVQTAAVIHLGEDDEVLNVITARVGNHFEADLLFLFPAIAIKKVLTNSIDYKILEDHLLLRKENPIVPPLYALDTHDGLKPAHTLAPTPAGLSDAGTATPLSDLILTWEDVFAWEDASGSDSNIRKLFENEVHYIADRSYELDHRCPIECIKQVWYTEPEKKLREDGQEYTYFRQTTIIVMLAENEEAAARLSDSMIEYRGVWVDPRSNPESWDRLIAPADNTHIRHWISLYGLPGKFFILRTTRGPIALLVLSYDPPSTPEFISELDLIIEFANVQLYKLIQAGW